MWRILANAMVTCAADGKRPTRKPQRNQPDIVPRQVHLLVRRFLSRFHCQRSSIFLNLFRRTPQWSPLACVHTWISKHRHRHISFHKVFQCSGFLVNIETRLNFSFASMKKQVSCTVEFLECLNVSFPTINLLFKGKSFKPGVQRWCELRLNSIEKGNKSFFALSSELATRFFREVMFFLASSPISSEEPRIHSNGMNR
jgi:hypothetical protein